MADDDLTALAARAISIAESAVETQGKIVDQQGRARRTVRWLAVSVALDIILSVTCIFLALNQSSVSHQIHLSQLASCKIGDQFRGGQRRLWDHVLVISRPPPHETAADRERRLARLAAFRAYVARQFEPVDCKSLYGK